MMDMVDMVYRGCNTGLQLSAAVLHLIGALQAATGQPDGVKLKGRTLHDKQGVRYHSE